MKKVHEKNIDNIFKNGLEDPVDEIGFENRDWDALEQMLDKGKKPAGIVYWLPALSGAAAILLIALGWWFFKPMADKTENKPQVVVNGGSKTKPQVPAVEETVKTGNIPVVTGDKSVEARKPEKTTEDTAFINQISGTETPVAANGLLLTGASQTGVSITNSGTPVLAPHTLPKPAIINTNQTISGNWADDEKPGKVSTQKSTSAFRPQLGLSVVAASDLNGTNAVSQSSKGTNVGLLFSVGINKLTITTGAMYSVKPYSANGGAYYSSPGSYKYGNTPAAPQSIAVDCRMLDIPLNIDYQLYNRRNNKISLGTGLSSYIMTHESYQYTYADPSRSGPAGYEIKSPGRYLFSVMNLQATYQRRLNSKFGVSVQPYFKIPLSNIGYSQVKLQTLGVAIGVNWNINSLSKPK